MASALSVSLRAAAAAEIVPSPPPASTTSTPRRPAARFNADPRRLHESSGCAGKLAVFAVRLDTFQAEKDTAVFYVGSNDPDELTEIRRHILAHFQSLPIAGVCRPLYSGRNATASVQWQVSEQYVRT